MTEVIERALAAPYPDPVAAGDRVQAVVPAGVPVTGAC